MANHIVEDFQHQILLLRLPAQRELPRQLDETEAQIEARRGTLITLDTQIDADQFNVIAVMPYMADL